MLRTPVAFFIFNRPSLTRLVFDAIRQAMPSKLLVIADGPRHHILDEAEKCEKARSIVEEVDWDCEVLTNFSEVNLGCKKRVSSGLDWVFSKVEEAILLEDDCLPHPTFFRFCDELLKKYCNDTRVMAISGNNFQFGRRRTEYDYYFSRYCHCWGWATWQRSWQYYDISMNLWPKIRDDDWLKDMLNNFFEERYRKRLFQAVYDNQIDTWAYQWTFTCWIQSGLTILPQTNLVSNIGFSADSTHTKDARSPLSNMEVNPILFPMKHPEFMIRDFRADRFTWRNLYSLQSKIKAKLRSLLAN